MNSLYNKHILKISDLTKQEIKKIITFASILKKNRQNKQEIQYLKNKKIALIFEQKSTRTRCSFEVAAIEQGACVSYLGSDIHLGYKESITDTIKVLERLYDGIAYRGSNHQDIKIISQNSQIPIWNALTQEYHPTQILSDILTIIECMPNKAIENIICTYVGDASNNIAKTLLEIAQIMKLKLRFLAPKKYWPKIPISKNKNIKNNIMCTENIKKGVELSDFIYTDTWISMGEDPLIWKEKIQILKKYQVNEKMIQLSNNKKIQVLHCLPSLHDSNTILGKKISKKYKLNDGIEITNTVFQKYQDIIFTQSENKLHTIKALMILSLIKNINNQ